MIQNVGRENAIDPSQVDLATYKDTKILSNYISDQGKILSRRVTGLNSKQQKRVTKLIKTARVASLLPFVIGKG
jgi:small subunit ribosomal protein S18